MSHEVKFLAGWHISVAAEQLIATAGAYGNVHGVFNDITLKATPSSSVAGVVTDYDRQSEARAVAWRNSPEGKATARAREANVQSLQENHDLLMRDLASLDFANDVAVLDWLCAIQEATDDISVVKRKTEVLNTFKKHGFEPGANCGDAFKAEDRDNHFRWIVGQALDTLEHVAIHGIIHKFTDEWKTKFVGASS